MYYLVVYIYNLHFKIIETTYFQLIPIVMKLSKLVSLRECINLDSSYSTSKQANAGISIETLFVNVMQSPDRLRINIRPKMKGIGFGTIQHTAHCVV